LDKFLAIGVNSFYDSVIHLFEKSFFNIIS